MLVSYFLMPYRFQLQYGNMNLVILFTKYCLTHYAATFIAFCTYLNISTVNLLDNIKIVPNGNDRVSNLSREQKKKNYKSAF